MLTNTNKQAMNKAFITIFHQGHSRELYLNKCRAIKKLTDVYVHPLIHSFKTDDDAQIAEYLVNLMTDAKEQMLEVKPCCKTVTSAINKIVAEINSHVRTGGAIAFLREYSTILDRFLRAAPLTKECSDLTHARDLVFKTKTMEDLFRSDLSKEYTRPKVGKA